MIKYRDCDRCGRKIILGAIISEGERQYVNGLLCGICVRVRQFDDENPILYPS